MAARTELAFLYQTRTILCRSVRKSSTNRRLLSSQTHSLPAVENDVVVGHGEESFLKEKARQVAESQAAPKSIPRTVGTSINSTITARERRAFESILRFAPKQPEPVSVKGRLPSFDAVDTDIDNILRIFTSPIQRHHSEREGSSISNNDQVSDGIGLALGADSNSLGETTSIIRTEAEDRSVQQRVFEDKVSANLSEANKPPIPQTVRDRMSEISNALHAAAASTTKRGDLAMWEVCESRIFSLASYLQQPLRKKVTKVVRPPKFRFSRESSDNPAEMIEAAERELRASASFGSDSSVANELPPSSQSRPSEAQSRSWTPSVLHHVYPAALLLVLRLYISHFPSSQLPHNLLPRIRALGHTSYVLGASPQFYNSLMSLVWLTRSSLREIDALLSEMERGGVEHNEETYRILQQIENERAVDLSREAEKLRLVPGSRGGAWWKRHEQMFWFPRILDWSAVVAERVTAREMGLEQQ